MAGPRRRGYWYVGGVNLPTVPMYSPTGGNDEFVTDTAIYQSDESGRVDLVLVSDAPTLLAAGWSYAPTHKPTLAPKEYGRG